MVGREISAIFPKRAVPLGDVVLETRGLRRRFARPCGAGEILGIAGLVGSGRTRVRRGGLRTRAGGRARSCCAGEPVRIAIARRRDSPGHRLCPGGPAAARRRAGDADRGERQPGESRRPSRGAGMIDGGAGARPRAQLREAAANQDRLAVRGGRARSRAAISRRSRWRGGWRSGRRC